MNIIAHRGLFEKENEKNTLKAFVSAFENGFGVETDLRDYQGKLVLSHNVADEFCISVDRLFQLYKGSKAEKNNALLALNVKADGIQDLLMESIDKYKIENYFMFDMSVPEMVVYNNRKIPFFTRNSDIETECVLYSECKGVWVDAFYKDWDVEKAIKNHLDNNKIVSLISPEIHSKDEKDIWKMLKKTKIFENVLFNLCTDKPFEVEEYFGEK